MVPSNFVILYLLHKFIYFENVICLTTLMKVAKKFEFWLPCLREPPGFWYAQIFSYFVFYLYLFILKVSSV